MQRQRLPASQKRISCSLGLGFCSSSALDDDDEAGRADAALQGRLFEEGLLQRVQLVVAGDAFDGRDVGALDLDGEDAAGVDQAAVQDDGAGAAVAVVAAFLGAGEADALAQDFEQAVALVGEELACSSPLIVALTTMRSLNLAPSCSAARLRGACAPPGRR